MAMLLLASCATTPKLQLDNVDKTLTPAKAIADFTSQKDTRVLWGGIIVSSENLKQGSLLEVLAYPLSSNQQPDTQQNPLGRFIVEFPKYLETLDYAAGRIITVVGPLVEIRKGIIGEAEYLYPVITAEQDYLWSSANQKSEPNVHFGVGVMIHN